MSERTVTSSDELAQAIVGAARQGGVPVGSRLRSERSLAKTLGISHARVRQAFRTLVEAGILVQRHGSGTYLRQLPGAGQTACVPSLEARDLFYPQDERRPRDPWSHALPGQLDLGLWWEDLSVMSPVQQQVLAAMVHAVESGGHRLSLHAATSCRTRMQLDLDVLTRRVMQHPRDGYLVSAFISSEFEQVRKPDWPVVYFASASQPIAAEPSVMLDSHAGIELALHQMHAAGCRRIAVLDHESMDIRHRSRYEAAAALIGQDYRRFGMAALAPDHAAELTAALLTAAPKPDGLCITDQHLLAGVRVALAQLGLTPGRDLAVVVHRNRHLPLVGQKQTAWSCVEYDLEAYAHLAVEKLVQAISSPDQRRGHLAVRPVWIQGQTHALRVNQGACM